MESSESPSHDWEVEGPSPPFPYIPGFSIKIRPYTSPTASEMQAQIDYKRSLEARYPPGIHKIPAIEYCIAKPHCQLETEQTTETSVSVDSRTETKFRAKIYDPVYASYMGFAESCANQHFNSEAEAYTRLEDACISREVTPAFSGAWIMDVPVPSKDYGGVDCVNTRPVPLLLLKQVEAANLADTYIRYYHTSGYVEPQPQLPQVWRREVLAKIYEAQTLLGCAGVFGGASEHHVLVKTSALEDGRLDVKVFITDASIADVSGPKERTGKTLEQPVAPIETCWTEVRGDGEWLVWEDWGQPEDVKYYRQWLVERWGQSTKYRPLSEKLQKRIAEGKWEEEDVQYGDKEMSECIPQVSKNND